MKKSFSVLVCVIALFALEARAYDEPGSEAAALPEHLMKQLVRKIVIDHFVSEKRRGKVPFSDQNIKREWLPKMRGIEFVFADGHSVQPVHFFKELTKEGDVYEVSFGWGDPDCTASGLTWSFSVVNGAIAHLRVSGGWGSGCSSCGGN